MNESLCRLGYGNAKYNFHNAKDSYHSFIYRCCCFLRYSFGAGSSLCVIQAALFWWLSELVIQAIGSFGYLSSRSGGISFCAWLSL